MLKYYVLLIFIAGMALFYAYSQDPCNRQLRADFSSKYPGYKILRTGADQGSPASVHCEISYQEFDGGQVYEESWLYLNSDDGWVFSRVIESRQQEEPAKASQALEPQV